MNKLILPAFADTATANMIPAIKNMFDTLKAKNKREISVIHDILFSTCI